MRSWPGPSPPWNGCAELALFWVGWWVVKTEGRGEGFVESCDYGFEGGGDGEGSQLGWY